MHDVISISFKTHTPTIFGLSLLWSVVFPLIAQAHPETEVGSCHFHTHSAEQHCSEEPKPQSRRVNDDASAEVQALLPDDDAAGALSSLPEVIADTPENNDGERDDEGRAENFPGTVDQFQQLEARTSLIAGIQGGLARLGYHPGPATGMMTSSTTVAIKAFQEDQLLPVSGQPSLSLLTIIEDELAIRRDKR